MKSKIIFLVVIIAIVVVGIMFYNPSQISAPAPVSTSPADTSADTTTSITDDLNSINVGSGDADFQSIDNDINSL